MRKWIWTFGVGTPWAGKYVITHTSRGDGRERVFEVFGQENCSMSYLYEDGMKAVEKYGLELAGEFQI